MAGILLSNALSASSPRRQMFTLTASNASLAVPTWAQGGKGVVLVTGSGGGGGGGRRTVSGGGRGGGGGSGARAERVSMHIPSGVTTIAVVVGSAGSGLASGTTDGNGTAGGSSTVTVSTNVLTLGGGTGGTGGTGGSGGAAGAGGVVNPITNATFTMGDSTYSGSTAKDGIPGGAPTTASFGYGAGGPSEFGIGGAGVASASVSTNGANAIGYGAGGAGALSISAVAATSGNGAPGIIILEFVEGF